MVKAAADEIKRTGAPCIVLDPGRVDQWRGVPHAKTLAEVHRAAWVRRESVALAASPEDCETLCEALEKTGAAAGGFTLVIDELREYASSNRVGDKLVLLARRHRHAKVSMLLGTQSIGDLRTDLISAVDTIHTGRNMAPYNLETLKTRYGLEPEKLKALGRGEFITTYTGFAPGE